MIITKGYGGFQIVVRGFGGGYAFGPALAVNSFSSVLVDPLLNVAILQNTTKRIELIFENEYEVNFDPFQLTVKIYKPENTDVVFLNETYSSSSVNLKRKETGKFYIDFTGSSDMIGDYHVTWSWKDTQDSIDLWFGSHSATVVPLAVYNTFPYLRNQIDRAQKDLSNICGYTDFNLYVYLKGGLQEINRMPPNTSFSFIDYPWNLHQQLLVDTATFVGLQSQGLVAIDSDANYSLQGNAFVVDHWSKISSFMSMLQNRINEHLKQFKLSYLTRLSATKIERGPGFRQVGLFTASPSGTSFGSILGVR